MQKLLPGAVVVGAGMALALTAGLTARPIAPVSPAARAITPPCPAPARMMARLELLFGTTKADGAIVDEADWLSFLDREVTPRFPDGLTVLTGTGQWRNAKGQIGRETSRVLLIWYQPDPQSAAHIAAIRDSYKQRFNQESVMRVDGAGCVEF